MRDGLLYAVWGPSARGFVVQARYGENGGMVIVVL